VALEEIGFAEVRLMDGEQVATTLDLKKKPKGSKESKEAATSAELLVLTNRRVMHVRAASKSRESVLVSLADVFAFEVADHRPNSFGGYVWGAVAFIVAIAVWRVWNVDVLDVVAAVIIAAMGIYLIVDQMFAPSSLQATIRAGSSQLQVAVDHDAAESVYAFANKLFETRGEMLHPKPPAPAAPVIVFAPR